MSFHSSHETMGPANAVWDDGEWVSWAEINRYVEEAAVDAEEGDFDVLEEDEEWLELDELSVSDPSPERTASPEKKEPLHKIWDQLMKLIRQAESAKARGEKIDNQIGEIGEVYAEAELGIKRHRRHAQGSDGKLGNEFVEVKTISPWKKKPVVRVKRAGHWTKLVIVRISARWIFEWAILDRKQLGSGCGGKYARVSWKRGKQVAAHKA